MSICLHPHNFARRLFHPAILVLICLGCGVASGSYGLEIPRLEFVPRQYFCRRAEGPITVDGRLDEPDWQRAAPAGDFVDIEGPAGPSPRLATTVRMLWDDDCFYVAARLDDPHVWGTLTQRDAVIYHDNDFEVFIDPDGDNHLYYELEINALGTPWDLMLIRPYRDGGPAVNAWDIQGLLKAVRVEGTLNDPGDVDQGWTVEIAFPWNVLAQTAGRPAPPGPGDIWRVNFSRVQWDLQVREGRYEKAADPDTGIPLPEHNWVWSPQGLIAMHFPEMWGEVMFTVPGTDQDFETSPEHKAILAAASLMPVYYMQRQWHLDHGRFAASLKELGLPDASLPVPDPVAADFTSLPLPPGWALSLETCGDGFTARLVTPEGTATVDQDGRLERTP